jgi:hypothetical protein
VTNEEKIKEIKKVMSYLSIKRKQYWINRIANAKTIDGKYNIARRIKTDDLGIKNEN